MSFAKRKLFEEMEQTHSETGDALPVVVLVPRPGGDPMLYGPFKWREEADAWMAHRAPSTVVWKILPIQPVD